MPMWRCPHCGTPQSESSRCWVCKQSSTSCGTCRHFRKSIAGHLGYCGLDPRRLPIRADEMRGCWEARPLTVTAPPVPRLAMATGRLDFVPIGSAPRARARRPPKRRDGAATRAPDPALGFWGEEP